MPTPVEDLAELRAAYRRLISGGQVVEVRDSNGDSIRYSQANISRLLQEIHRLEAEVAGSPRVVPPLRPIWG